jgi:hypothetical protein
MAGLEGCGINKNGTAQGGALAFPPGCPTTAVGLSQEKQDYVYGALMNFQFLSA